MNTYTNSGNCAELLLSSKMAPGDENSLFLMFMYFVLWNTAGKRACSYGIMQTHNSHITPLGADASMHAHTHARMHTDNMTKTHTHRYR